ncbi:hypothetical protein [Methylobacterium sp. ID0610]|uniref:hypothetical protein n=1 Tax=Methylobacterium carpenticola TaxID=3344827 RepID=UPI0036B06027
MSARGAHRLLGALVLSTASCLAPSAGRAQAINPLHLDQLTVAGGRVPNAANDAVDLSAAKPPGTFTAPFALYSFCSDVGCLPGDRHRAQFLNRWVSRYGADRLEYGAVFDGRMDTGRADPWAPNTAYRVGQQIDTNGQGDAAIFEVVAAGTSGPTSASMPRGTGQSIPDGSVRWRQLGFAGTNAKAVLGVSGIVGPNGGRSWGIVNDLILKPDAQRAFAAAIESDFGNESGPCDLGRHSCYNIFLYGLSSFTSTALIAAGTPNTGPGKDYHFGLWLKGAHLVQDVSILDETESAIGLRFANGSHAVGTIVDETVSPASVHVQGSHSTAAFVDTSHSASALLAKGQYGYAVLNTQGATGPGGRYALTLQPGQLVCFAGQEACVGFDARSGKLAFQVGGQTVFSVDKAGNVRARGTIAQGVAP